MKPLNAGEVPDADSLKRLVRAHFRVGWLGLLVFATLGTALEALHAWKSGDYLAVGNETRRLMWTLAHAHGAGLSLVQIAFAATAALCPEIRAAVLVRASRLLHCAFALIPSGFLLGGIATYGADPGLGVLLVPLGALALLVGITVLSWELWRH